MHMEAVLCMCIIGVYVYGCVCVSVHTYVCVTSPRWRRGGHEVAGEQQFRVIRTEVAHFSADRWSFTRIGRALEPARQLPVGSRRRFCSTPVLSKPSNLSLRWTSTRQHHPTTTPPGVSCAGSQTGPPSRPLVATVAGLPGVPRRSVYDHGAQLPLAPGLSGVGLASPPL